MKPAQQIRQAASWRLLVAGARRLTSPEQEIFQRRWLAPCTGRNWRAGRRGSARPGACGTGRYQHVLQRRRPAPASRIRRALRRDIAWLMSARIERDFADSTTDGGGKLTGRQQRRTKETAGGGEVLRQCVIALRLAQLLGLDDLYRSVATTALSLVNVGCHSDAHEQAKWFGDDIALKSTKYTYDMRSLRGAAASMRLIGSGNPPLHWFRVGLAIRDAWAPRDRRHDPHPLPDRALAGTEHIYAKIGTTNRASASLFAVLHGLLAAD